MVLGRDTEPSVVLGQVAIQEAQLGDYSAALVGEQWEGDPLGSREFAQDRRWIVADADQTDPTPLELVLDLLQLN